jgi:hypothetical protein
MKEDKKKPSQLLHHRIKPYHIFCKFWSVFFFFGKECKVKKNQQQKKKKKMLYEFTFLQYTQVYTCSTNKFTCLRQKLTKPNTQKKKKKRNKNLIIIMMMKDQYRALNN